ncbi:hypothetical protein [Dyella sp.]|uniref:hypothetical protein n=1 Tax=Dyella sp. TaxID=1869338 RepID=UPI002ED4C220
MNTHGSFRKVWGIPLVLAVLTMAGLLSALLGEPMVWKVLAWAGLAIPVTVCLYFSLPLKRQA